MTDAVLPGVVMAVMLFWGMGAYKRLLRLRSQCKSKLVALVSLVSQFVTIVKTNYQLVSVSRLPSETGDGEDCASLAWTSFAKALEQFKTSLSAAQLLPLNEKTMQGLGLSLDAMGVCWHQLRDLPPDLAGAALPGILQRQWDELDLQVEVARAEFNQQVLEYNEAMNQFPALLLARVLGLKAAQPI